MRVGPLVFALVLFAIVGWMLWESGDFTEEARRMPFVIAVPTVGLLGLQLAREGWALAKGKATAADVAAEDDAGGQQPGDLVASEGDAAGDDADADAEQAAASAASVHPAWPFVAVLALAVAFWVLGLLVAVPVFIALFTWWYGRERWLVIILMALGTWAVVYFFFVVLLQLPIYDGWLWEAVR